MPRSVSPRCRAPAPAPVCGSVVLKRAVHAVQAGGCAEETLGNMRTVASLGAEDELQTKYEGFLAKAYSSAVSQAVVMGAGISVSNRFRSTAADAQPEPTSAQTEPSRRAAQATVRAAPEGFGRRLLSSRCFRRTRSPSGNNRTAGLPRATERGARIDCGTKPGGGARPDGCARGRYGSTLITTEVQNLQTGQVWNGADVLSTFFCILIGAMVGGEIGPVVDALSKGGGISQNPHDITLPVIHVNNLPLLLM